MRLPKGLLWPCAFTGMLVALLTFGALSSCGKEAQSPYGSSYDSGDDRIKGLTPVDAADKAQNVVYWIAKAANEAVSKAGTAPFNAKIVNGRAGTATVTGDTSFTDLSSPSCVGQRKETSISKIVFDGYQPATDVEVVLSGEISYHLQASSHSCVSGSGYANCTFNMDSMSPVKIRIVYGNGNGYDETVSFSVHATSSSSTDCSGYRGTLTASNGTTYQF